MSDIETAKALIAQWNGPMGEYEMGPGASMANKMTEVLERLIENTSREESTVDDRRVALSFLECCFGMQQGGGDRSPAMRAHFEACVPEHWDEAIGWALPQYILNIADHLHRVAYTLEEAAPNEPWGYLHPGKGADHE